MRNLLISGLIVSVLILTGCGSSSSSDPLLSAIEQALGVEIRVVHASADAPAVNVLVNNDEILSNVEFKQGSGILNLAEDTYDIAVEAIIPGGNATVINLPDTPLDEDTDYTVLAIGNTSDLLANGPRPLQALVLANPDTEVSAGSARAQVVHASPAAPEVRVFVTAPGADLATATPLGDFSFGENLGPVEVPADTYQIRVTLPFTPPAAPVVVYDAGNVPLGDGDDVVVVAVNNTNAGDAPISLLVLAGDAVLELLDVGTPANVRAVHASPDTVPVDVIVENDFANPLVADLAFPDFSGYAAPPAGTYNVKVVDAATQSVNPLELDLTLEAGLQYSVIAAGFFNDLQTDSLVLVDDNRRIATEGRVRIVHASPSAGPVDIYVVAPGTDILTATPAFENVFFGADTGYVSLAPGSYDLAVTPAGDPDTVAIGAPIQVNATGIYTAIARDAAGGGTPLGVIELDDLIIAP
ncbi:MAG: DUF4397 domain-containing protein [Gammaproteobacteria bacterium]|nr:DUF4397 domain-containing protein [Gammaproteobacteria bacterium]